MLGFPSAPYNTCGTRHKATSLASASKRKSTFILPSQEPNSTDFFQKPQNPPRALPVHDVIHIPKSNILSGIFILTSVNDTSSPHTR